MALTSSIDHLTNPLVSAAQLYRLQDDAAVQLGEHTLSIRFAQAQLTQTAGVLLRLPQEVIATAIVILQRFIVNGLPDNTTNIDNKMCSAAAIYLAAKLSFTPLAPRSVINVYAYLASAASPLWFVNPGGPSPAADARSYYISEGTYERERQRLFVAENMILAGIGFDTQVVLPHTLALTYLQALGASSSSLAKRVLEHLNSALLSPQLLYLTNQPNALAVAAIYLAARETSVRLVEENWWEVFDVDREDLGFLVLAYGSFENFVQAERQQWEGKKIPLT